MSDHGPDMALAEQRHASGPVDQKTLKYGRIILFEVEPPRRLASCKDHIKKSDPFSAMKK
ncbi:Mipc synthase [Colletotrichum asianum]